VILTPGGVEAGFDDFLDGLIQLDEALQDGIEYLIWRMNSPLQMTAL